MKQKEGKKEDIQKVLSKHFLNISPAKLKDLLEWLKQNSIDHQKIDFTALDGGVSWESLKEALKGEYGLEILDDKEKVARARADEIRDNEQRQKEIREEEQQLLKDWKEQPTKDLLAHTKIDRLKDFVLMTAKKYNTSLIVSGRGGLGKTYNTIQILKKEEINFSMLSGFSTPLSLYIWLYKHKDENILLDDCDGIFNNEKAVSIMKNALWDKDGKRILNYESTSKQAQDVPSSFEFTGNLIILINEITNEKNISQAALLSRCIHYELDFTYEETKAMIGNILEKTELAKQQKDRICDIIDKKTSVATENFNFRTLSKLVSYVKYDISKADILFDITNKEDETVKTVWELMNSNLSVEQQITEFKNKTDKGRATYYRIKKRLLNERKKC